jgi:hypothetical protein
MKNRVSQSVIQVPATLGRVYAWSQDDGTKGAEAWRYLTGYINRPVRRFLSVDCGFGWLQVKRLEGTAAVKIPCKLPHNLTLDNQMGCDSIVLRKPKVFGLKMSEDAPGL